MTLRTRLTVLYIAVATVAIVGLGVMAYVATRNATFSSVDRTLEADARAVESSFEVLFGPLTPADVTANRLALDRQAVEGITFQIRDADGAVIYASSGASLLPFTRPTLESGSRDIVVGGQETRVLLRPIVRFGATIGSVEVRTSLAQANASVAAVRNVLGLGAFLAVAVSGAVAFYVAGHAAQPVRALSSLADEIERTAAFTRRLPAPRSTREMTEMAATFNRMIDRIEGLINTQKRFLADTSHELRRPLTILRTDIDILTDPALSPEELANVQAEMRVAATSMSNLLTELLILAREDEDVLHLTPLDLAALCRSACEATAAMHPLHTYELHIPDSVWVEGDRPRLERMIGNILGNAAAYTDAPGHIQCRLTNHGRAATLTVRDDGPGIASHELHHIFDRFYRGSLGRQARPEGTGLGLPIVRQVARSHGGDVIVESEPGLGTTVTVNLPALMAPERQTDALQAV